MMDSNERGHEPRLGLRKVVPAEGVIDNTTLDIIAIHGLDTESPRTWTYKKNGSPDVNWLEDSDMLQAAVPNARIYTYNWNAKVFDDAPVQRLLGHADTLLSLVAGEQGPNNRPIIFIASCFGGLILAEAMNRAGQKDSPYQRILLNTVGIVFLATPFRGSDVAKPASWCMLVGGIMGKRTSEQLVEDLNRKDKELRKLTQLFAELVHTHSAKLPVHCFYETHKTKILRKWFPSKLVTILPPFLSNKAELLLVTEDSACLDGPRRYPLNGAHSMMNKFDGPESANYLQVRNVIKELANNASTSEYQSAIQGLYISQETMEDIRRNGTYLRVQVDRIVSHLEAQPPIEDIQAIAGNVNGVLRKYARTRSEITNADGHIGSPSVPTNSIFEVDIPNRTARLSYPMSSSVLHASDNCSELARGLNRLKCKCKAGRSLRIWNRGPLGFKVETQGAQGCPVHGQRRSTSYTIEAKLSPWINKTLELALLLNSGKVSGICPSFKFRGTVQRCESAMFQLFDQFVDECLTVMPLSFYTEAKPNIEKRLIYIRKFGERQSHVALWDYGKSTRAMSQLVRRIIEAIRAEKASGDDSDENGNTLLTEIVHLANLIGGHFHSVAPQMHSLLQLAQDSNVDPMVEVSMNMRKYNYVSYTNRPMTAMSHLCYVALIDTLANDYFAHDNSPMDKDNTIFQALKSYEGAIESLGSVADWGVSTSTRVNSWKLFLAYPELAEGFNYPDLHLSIIRRSLSALKGHIHPDWSEPKRLNYSYLDPAELALGWTEGLQFLVDRGCYIGKAFELACQMRDVESASILLSSSSDIFSARYTSPNLLRLATRCPSIFRLAAKELWHRRDELKRFVIRHFNFKQQLVEDFFGSLELDESTHGRLAEITGLPDRLQCWDIGSPHCFENEYCTYPTFNVDFHKELYEVGFVDIQAPCRHGMTPLAEYCLFVEGVSKVKIEWFDTVVWFAEKGANLDFSHRDQTKLRWPHMQFYMALATDRTEENEIFGIDKSTLTTDSCRCSCSSKGCIPPFLLWSCSLAGNGYHVHRCCKYRMPLRERKLKHWIKLCGFKRHEKEKLYKELCRRELFDRLGMGHTCCAALNFQPAQEKHRLWSEDASARNELLWLIKVYETTRKLVPDVTVIQFWAYWWNVADEVLLPLLPEEACQYPDWLLDDWSSDDSHLRLTKLKDEIEGRRLHRWLTLRKEAGYEGWEDNQVFKIHFTRFWLLAKAHRQRLASWKRHRLVIKPRFILMNRRKMAYVPT